MQHVFQKHIRVWDVNFVKKYSASWNLKHKYAKKLFTIKRLVSHIQKIFKSQTICLSWTLKKKKHILLSTVCSGLQIYSYMGIRIAFLFFIKSNKRGGFGAYSSYGLAFICECQCQYLKVRQIQVFSLKLFVNV